MKNAIVSFIYRARMGLLGGALVAAMAGLAFSNLVEAKEKEKNPPAKLKLADAPIQREGKSTVSFAPVVKKISPSVVNIFTTTKPKRVNAPYMPFLEDPFFRRFFGEPFEGPGGGSGRNFQPPKQHGLGSGVIVTEDGYILTNNHVVDQADEIKVGLNSGKAEYAAKVVGKDPSSDLAVLKIEAGDLPVATIGNSDHLEVGDVVLAIGNPFGVGQSVTMGIVSATGRTSMGLNLDYEDFIQTDAAINPGNSGGALADAEGRLVGINTAILSRTGGNHGIGFAVPINMARNIMDGLINNGKVVRGYLGVSIQNITPELAQAFDVSAKEGALVAEVMDDTPAQKAGLKSGDLVVEFNGIAIRDSHQLRMEVAKTAPKSEVKMKVLRGGKPQDVTVELEELPAGGLASVREGGSANESDSLRGVAVSDLDKQARSQLGAPDEVEGVVVTQVEPDSAAYEAGLREGDIIREINRKPVRSAREAVSMTRELKDKAILLRIWSKGGSRYLVVDETQGG